MKARATLLVILVIAMALGVVPSSQAALVVDGTVPSVSMNVGAGYLASDSRVVSIWVRNTGPDNVTITSVDASDPIPGYVYANHEGGGFSQMVPNTASDRAEVRIRVTAVSNQGNTDTSTPSTVTITHTGGTLTASLPVSVRDWRTAQLELASTQSVTHSMPCPRATTDSTSLFTVRVSNTGDYPMSVYSVSLSMSRLQGEIRPLSTATFQVEGLSSVDRQFQVTLRGYHSEGTFRGTLRASSTGGGSDTGEVVLTVDHPVEVVLPTQTTRHDFGQVELMQPPQNPWSHIVEERCGYQSGTISVDTPAPPGFVQVEPDPLFVPAGDSAVLRVTPRFNSSHASLLLSPQDFTVKFVTDAGVSRSYDFQATPSFISVQEVKGRLQELSQEGQSPETREVARRTFELLVNRTEVRRPTTATDLEDAGRIVGLAEPVILVLEQFAQMRQWNHEGRQEQAVQSLSVLAAGLEALRSVCNGVVVQADRTECLAIVSLLEDSMASFAEEARRHFEGLSGGGLTELGELRAAESLALVLEALGDEQGSASFEARAQQRFANFTARLTAADDHLANVRAREALLTPVGFVGTNIGYVAWHPLGIVFMESFEAYATAEFEAARTELRQAGDDNRLRDLDAEAETVNADLAAGRLMSWAVTAVYLLFLAAILLRFSSAWLRRRGDRRLVERGDVVLGKTGPLV